MGRGKQGPLCNLYRILRVKSRYASVAAAVARVFVAQPNRVSIDNVCPFSQRSSPKALMNRAGILVATVNVSVG